MEKPADMAKMDFSDALALINLLRDQHVEITISGPIGGTITARLRGVVGEPIISQGFGGQPFRKFDIHWIPLDGERNAEGPGLALREKDFECGYVPRPDEYSEPWVLHQSGTEILIRRIEKHAPLSKTTKP
jgi:hypothetical protein